MASFDEFIDSITSDGNDGKAFERFCKHFLETSPEYAGQFEKVWLWNDWPDKWSIDKGIDIIAKYKNSVKFCAIQTKCYAAHQTVPYGEVTNFLADSSRAEIEDRILMMSTNKLSEKTSKEVISGQEKQVIIRDRQYFESINYEYPRHISELSKSKEKEKAKPRPHQVAAINEVEVGLKENDRGQLIMACGTGKTFTTLWVKERLQAKTVLVLLPSLNLLSQTMREWVWGANEQFEVLAVCSDPTVSKSKNSEDISTAEVGKVTWHVEEIKSFLKQPSPKVIFCTYQSSELIQEVQKDESIPSFDLAVCDEAHRCAGKAGSSFTTILVEEKIRARKRLFTTATPRYFSKNIVSAAEGRGVEIVGMDDEVTFGPVVHQLTFGQAINYSPEPLLTDYQVVVVGVTEPMVREWIREAEILSTETGSVDARTLATKIAVLKAIKEYNLSRVISFHSQIKFASQFSKEVNQILEIIEPNSRPSGKIWSEYVAGKMSAGKRRDLINKLKDLDGFDIGILSNARCLSEGVDVPALDGIAFVDPKESLVDIIQAVGRAIRKSENKTLGTIVLPVFLEEFDDPDQIIEASKFQPIWNVLKALRAHDEVFAENLDQYRTQLGSGSAGSSSKSKKIIFDLPRDLPSDFSETLYTRLVEVSTQNWSFWYGVLLKYFEEHAHINFSQDFEYEGHKIGAWLSRNRQDYRSGQLSTEKIMQLEDLGIEWEPLQSRLNKKKELGFKYLELFFQKYKHSVVRYDYVTDDGFNLGSWVVEIRQKATQADRKRLMAFNFVFNTLDESWEYGIKMLLLFKDIKKHANPKKDEKILDPDTGDEFSLGNWLAGIRSRIRSEPTSDLSTSRQQVLEEIGSVIDIDDANWELAFSALKTFHRKNGHFDIPKKETYLDCRKTKNKLKGWLERQRTDYRSGSLDTCKSEKLQTLGVSLGYIDDQWEKALARLAIYKEQTNSTQMKRDYRSSDGFNLPAWFQQQKAFYKRGDLSSARSAKIMALGFDLLPKKNHYLSYSDLKKLVMSQEIGSASEYRKFRESSPEKKKLYGSPANYYSEWVSWYDFLGKSDYEAREFIPFQEARDIVRKRKFKSINEYKKMDWQKLDLKIPVQPYDTYKEKWTNWSDYLGTEIIGQGFEYFTYKEAKEWVQKHRVKDWKHFEELKSTDKLPLAMPKKPDSKYKDNGWTSAADFFMSARKPPRKL